MKKVFKLITTIIILTMLLLCFVACKAEIKEVTVTCMDENKTLKTVPYSSLDSFIPEKEGYIFNGWYLDKEATSPASAIKSDSTVYASWQIATYSVKFVDNTGKTIYVDEQEHQIVEHGKSAKAPTAPSVDGYVFVGWDKTFDNVKSNLIVTALYSAEEYTLSFYNKNNQLVTTKTTTAEEDLSTFFNTLSYTMQQDADNGFTFAGWQVDSNDVDLKDIKTTANVYPVYKVAEINNFTVKTNLQNFQTTYRENLTVKLWPYNFVEYPNIDYSYTWLDQNQNKVGEGKEFSVSTPSAKSHKYYLKVTASANNSTQEKIVPCDFVIDKADLENITASAISTTYSASNVSFANINNLKENDLIEYSVDNINYSENEPQIKNAGNYTVYAKIYRENYNPTQISFNVSIAKKEVSANISNTLAASYGQNVSINCEYIGIIENDNVQMPNVEYVYKKLDATTYSVCSANTIYTPGEYEINVSKSFETDNYTFVFNKGKLTVSKANLLITLKNKEITYGEPAPNFEYETVNGLVNGDSVSILPSITYSTSYSYDTLSNRYSNVGDYIIEASSDNHQNYNITFENATLSVKKAKLTISVDNINNVEYGSDIPAFNYTLSGLVNNDTKASLNINPSYSTLYTKTSNYTEEGFSVSMNEFDLANYEPTFNAGKLNMVKAPLIAKVKPLSVVYGNTPDYEIEYSGFKNSDSALDIIASNKSISGYPNLGGVKDGGYEITLTGLSSDNYSISYATSILTVLPKAITVMAVAKTINYRDARPTFSVESNGFVGEDNNLENLSFSCLYQVGSNVGEYTITPHSGINKNYNITYAQNILTVAPRNITITINDIEVIFGDEIEAFSYAKIDNFPLTDNVSNLHITYSANEYNATSTKTVKAGGYDINADISNDNYNATINKGTITVLPRLVKVKYTKKALFHENSFFSVNASKLTFTNLVNSTNVSGNLTLNENVLNKVYTNAQDNSLGQHFMWDNLSVTLNDVDVSNSYVFEYSLSVELVNKQFNYEADNISTMYTGNTYTPQITVDLTSYSIEYSLDNDTYVSSISFKNAINTTLFFRITDLNEQDPCEVVEDSISVTIQKVTLSIKAINAEITYGDLTPQLQYTVEGFVNNENETNITAPQISSTYSQFDTAGDYAIVVSNASADNYSFNYTNATLKVLKKTISAKVQNKQVSYSDEISGYNIEYTGLVKDSDIDEINTEHASYTTSYTSSSPVNSTGYSVSVNNLYSNNYNFEYFDGLIIVNKKNVTIKPKDAQVIFGESAPTFELECTNATLKETVTAQFSCSYTSLDNAGQYTVTILDAQSNNYEFTTEPGVLTVNKKVANIIIAEKSITFGDQKPAFTHTYANLAVGDSTTINTTITYSCSYNVGNNIGEYDISATAEDTINYTFTCTSSKLIVSPKTVNISFAGVNTFTYTGLDQKSSIEAYYVDIHGAPKRARATTSPAEFINVGNYTVSAVIDDANYVANVTPCAMSIIKADYSNISHRTLSGVYDPEKTLLDYPLDANFSYLSSSEVPECNKLQYDIVYNADPANYNDYMTSVQIVLEKALCSVENNIFEHVYNSQTYIVEPTIIYKGTALNTVLYDLVYSNGDNFVNAATYLTQLTISSDNYRIEPTNLFIKIKGVAISGQYYTIEDALNTAVSGNTIIVKNNTEFADPAFANQIYNTDSYYTIKSGVTLLVPFDDAGTTKLNSVVSDATTIGTIFRQLTVPSNITLTCYGTITVNAKRGYSSNNAYQGGTVENYGQLNLEENAVINMKSGSTYNCNGFTVGKGVINLESGANAYDVLVLTMWIGGHAAKSTYKELFVTEQYLIQNIETRLNAYYGSNVYGRYYLHTSISSPEGTMSIIGNNAVFDLKSGYCSKYFNRETGKLELELHGEISTNSASLSLILGITLNTKDVEFPFPGNVDLYIKSGSHFIVNNRFKFLPGSNMFVEENSMVTINSAGKLFFFTNDIEVPFNGTYNNTTPLTYGNQTAKFYRKENGIVVPIYAYTKQMNANCVINGTLNINGSFGGVITTTSTAGKVVVNSTAKLSDKINYNLVIGKINNIRLSAEYTLVTKPLYGRIYLNGATTPTNMEPGTYTVLSNLTFTK